MFSNKTKYYKNVYWTSVKNSHALNEHTFKGGGKDLTGHGGGGYAASDRL